MLKDFFVGVETPSADGDGASAEMTCAVDVVGRVADDDELFGGEIELQMFPNAIGGERRKIATVVRLVTKRAGKREKAFRDRRAPS